MNRAAHKRLQVLAAIECAAEEGRLPQLTVGEVMTPDPVTVSAHTSAIQLVQLFQQNRFRHLLVTQERRLVGVVSDRDVIRLMDREDFQHRGQWDEFAAQDLMCDRPCTATPHTRLLEAVQTIAERGINCLPVVQGEEVVGIVTATDLYLVLEQVLFAVAAQPV